MSAGNGARRVIGMRCRECGTDYEVQATHVCEMCFGPLDVVYDYDAIRRRISHQSIAAGPPSMWRYRDLLPIEDGVPIVTLGEGFTPLVHAERLGAELGLSNLYLKNDSMNPTNSFKDRVVSVAISWARAHGFERRRSRIADRIGDARERAKSRQCDKIRILNQVGARDPGSGGAIGQAQCRAIG